MRGLLTARELHGGLQTADQRPRTVAAFRRVGDVLLPSMFAIGLRGRENVPATGPVILAGNHTSLLDGPVLWGLSPRPVTILVKAEIFVGPLGAYLRSLGQLPIHRDQVDRRPLLAALGALDRGGAVGLFPEGTRSTGDFTAVHQGIAFLALRSGAPVVPVDLTGTDAALPRDAVLPRWRSPVTLSYGRPFNVEADGPVGARRTVAAATEQIRAQLAAHHQRVAHHTSKDHR